MGSFRAVLELNGKQMDVLFSSVEFSRKTDSKGKPVTGVFGGRIKIIIESTEDTSIIESMLNNQFKPVSGHILYKKAEEDTKLKQIIFSNSYIVHYKETFKYEDNQPMTIFITFSAEEISIGSAYLDNRWK